MGERQLKSRCWLQWENCCSCKAERTRALLSVQAKFAVNETRAASLYLHKCTCSHFSIHLRVCFYYTVLAPYISPLFSPPLGRHYQKGHLLPWPSLPYLPISHHLLSKGPIQLCHLHWLHSGVGFSPQALDFSVLLLQLLLSKFYFCVSAVFFL